MIALKRPMFCPSDTHGSTHGKDVQIAKFGVGRYETGILPKPTTGYTYHFGSALEGAVRQLQAAEGIKPSGSIGAETWAVIWPLLDAYHRWQYRMWSVPLTAEELVWAKLLAAMQELDAHTPGYLLGGGHGIPLAQVSAYQRLDCSSSTSKALYEAGLFPHVYAWVSGQFEEWESPGPGKFFTVYANDGHVWTRLHKSRWWRFDTSPQGDGGRGPQLRYLPRFTGGFVARHYPGM